MITFINENILNLVFNTMNFKALKELFVQNCNATLSHILLKKITFEKLFKSIGKTRAVLNERKKWIFYIALLPVSNNIFLVSGDKQLDIYDTEKLKISKSFKYPYPYQINSILALPNDNIACRTVLGEIDIIDIKNNFEPIKTISLVDYFIKGIYLLPNGNLFCTAVNTLSEFMAIFDDDYNSTKIIDTHGHISNSIIFLPNRFAFSSWNKIEVWDLKDNYNLIIKLFHTEFVKCLLYIDKDCVLLSIYNNVIKEWDMKNYECVRTVNINCTINCAILLPNRFFAAGTTAEDIMIWDIMDLRVVNTFALIGNGEVTNLILLKDNRIVSCSYLENSLVIWS
jgi:hypothetical protein